MGHNAEAPLATKRRRKCCSCGAKVCVGETARKVRRYRAATEWEEMRGFGDEVQMADWYLCETCGDLADSLAELGFCYTLGDDSLAKQIDEYRREEAAHREYMKTHNVQIEGAARLLAQLPSNAGLGGAVSPAPTFETGETT